MKRYEFFCSYDGGGPADEQETSDGEFVRFSDAEAAVKQARIDALEEAKQACDVSEPGWTGYECPNTFQDGVHACAVAIESLKEAP